MLSIFLTAVAIYITVRILEKDPQAMDLGTVFMMVLIPAIVMILGNAAIGLLGLPALLSLAVLALSVLLVFLLSKHFFQWQWGKALILSVVYLVTLSGSSVLVSGLFAS
ncbi:hypothetical protein PVT67_16185 [Gallaecimonas kandeliae]|uniref:hypothetical protein n=1 Tax=Gallaecimonas kandeliae TaxID=3029055 RepID=UPI0026491044|nr:hypothetical protein [Gallaecimonas kandeliae]WKE65182.1 hypothetical protein PVT67_16185 [Gallaecimonas kandeliae]